MHHFFDFDADRMLQALSAKSLTEGRGVSLPTVKSSHLSKELYQPMIAWPPGYTFLLAPFYWLTKDLKWSSFLADILSAGFFLSVYFLLLKKLRFQNWIIGLLLLFQGLFISQDLVFSAPTDLLSVSFLLLSVYYSLIVLQKEKFSMAEGVILGILCFLPALFRYLYLPVAPVVPAVLFLYGWLNKNRKQTELAKTALTVTLLFAFLQLFLLLTTKGFSGNNYTPGASTSFDFTQLQNIHPFLFSSLLNLNFIAQQISIFTGYTYSSIIKAATILHYPVLLCVAFAGVIFFIKKWNKQDSLWRKFLFINLAISYIIVLTLCALSVLTKPVAQWTYVQEERYYKYISVFLPLVLFHYLYAAKPQSRLFISKAAKYFLVLWLCFEVFHGFYYISKNILPLEKWQALSLIKNEPYFMAMIHKYKDKGIDVVVASTDPFYYGHALLHNANALLKCEEVNGQLIAEKPTLLVVVLNEEKLPLYKSFLSKNGVMLGLIHHKKHFYSLFIPASL